MNSVKPFQGEGKSIGLMEFKGIMRLRLYVYSHNLKPCPVIAHSSTTGATEQI